MDGDDGLGDGFIAGRRGVGEKIGEELRGGEAGAGIAGVGSDFGEGNEDEGALGEARVRDFEAGLQEGEIAVEKNVEVEGAGSVGDGGGAVAAEVTLDGEQGVEQGARGEIGVEGDDGVEKAGLRRESDRRSGVKRGAGGDAAEGGEALGGCGECGGRRAGGAGEV